MFSEDVTDDSSSHTAKSIEKIEYSLSRELHSSELLDPTRVRHDSLSQIGIDPNDSIFSTGELKMIVSVGETIF